MNKAAGDVGYPSINSSGLYFGNSPVSVGYPVASTVVLTRVLADNHVLHTPTGHVALGWLGVEDLFTILLLVLLPVVLGAGEGNIWWQTKFLRIPAACGTSRPARRWTRTASARTSAT